MSRTRLAIFAAGMIVASAASVFAAPPAGEGWKPLFNGKDLSGWQVPEAAEGSWKVIDGVIDCTPMSKQKGERSITSEESFGDYQLYVEWRIKDTPAEYPVPTVLPDGSDKLDADGKPITTMMPNADSGIYMRGEGKSQVNIWCWPIGSGEVYGYRRDKSMSPEVRAGVTPKVKADKPVGEWNTFLITMKGDRLTVVLNDKTVLDQAQLPGVPASGPLVLQYHGGYDHKTGKWNGASSLVQFRNIYIREIK